MCFSACKDTNSGETKDAKTTNIEEEAKEKEAEVKDQKETVTVYAWVDNLRIRQQPDRKAIIVNTVPEGAKLEFLGEKTDFTEKINLRGSLFDEPWLKVKTEQGLEGWVFGGAIKFYQPTTTNSSSSPYDACFKYEGSKKESCILNTRAAEMRKNRLRVKKSKDGLTFILLNGQKVTLEATETNKYEFMYYIERMGYFVVKETTTEASRHLLVSDKSGDDLPIWGYPKPSPDFKSMVVCNADLNAGFEANGVQILSFTDNGFEVVYENPMYEYEPKFASWLSNDKISVNLEPAPGDAGKNRKIIELAKSDAGKWEVQ